MKFTYIIMGILVLSGITARADVKVQIKETDIEAQMEQQIKQQKLDDEKRQLAVEEELKKLRQREGMHFLDKHSNKRILVKKIKEQDELRSKLRSDTITLGKHLRAGDFALVNIYIQKALEYKSEHKCNEGCSAESREYKGLSRFEPNLSFCDKQKLLLDTARLVCQKEGGLDSVDQELMIRLLDKLAVSGGQSRTQWIYDYRNFFEYSLPMAVQNSDIGKIDKRLIALVFLHANFKELENPYRSLRNYKLRLLDDEIAGLTEGIDEIEEGLCDTAVDYGLKEELRPILREMFRNGEVQKQIERDGQITLINLKK